MSTARLAPGVALVSVPGRGLAVRTPDGEFLRVDTGGTGESALLAAVDGTGAGAGAGAGGVPPGSGPLLDAFRDAGYLTGSAESAPAGPDSAEPDPDQPGPGRLAGHRVQLLGDPVLVEPLGRCVRAEGGDVLPPGAVLLPLGDLLPPGDLGSPGRTGRTAVVWCLDSPVPPRLWDEADRLPSQGVAWLRCHREGAQAWLEPLAATPGDVTSAHIRLRRLAATPAHRELAAYWAGPAAENTGPGHTTASAALTAGLLMADLLAWASGRTGARRRLRRLDLRDLTVTEHPVLPVPEVAPLPAPRTAPAPAQGAGG
ncbi:hypothetical protein [Streptomyces jumonjinensis]|uniref:Uncharacterized protein n=1 Tax=Streptomyces jumonjinensis TaxID=1945 RepID=A0A646KEJ3_STRJU|nr:hypothetical protein [Streptomyces jumonjinensis]MQS99435.1 hypothetical protein [Streptomyces jumonjinensis]